MKLAYQSLGAAEMRLKRKLYPLCFSPTTTLKVVLFILITLMFAWMLVQIFVDKEAQFEIIVLDKLDHLESSPGTDDWKWSVLGFEYYANLRAAPHQITNIIAKTRAYNGLWVFRKNGTDSSTVKNYIRLSDFQYKKPKKVMLGLRYYISGSGRIEIILRSAISGSTETFALLQDEDEDLVAQGFCSKIISPGFNRLIDLIEIRAFALKPESMVVIDEVIVTVADGDSSRNLMYSLIPNQWCEEIQTNRNNKLANPSDKSQEGNREDQQSRKGQKKKSHPKGSRSRKGRKITTRNLQTNLEEG